MDSKRYAYISTGDAPIPIPILIHTIHTYNTYIHPYKQDSKNKAPTFQDFIVLVKKQRKKHVTTTFPPLLWDTFRECVNKRENITVKPNHLIEEFMTKYIRESFIQFNNQIQLTQFFINKPKQVNIARKIIVKKAKQKKHVNYSTYSLEQLEKAYLTAHNRGNTELGVIMELRKRGIDVKELRRKAIKT